MRPQSIYSIARHAVDSSAAIQRPRHQLPPPFLLVIEWVSIRIPNKLILHGCEKGVWAMLLLYCLILPGSFMTSYASWFFWLA